MRHLLILMWIKVHYHQNAFTILEFLKFTVSDKKKNDLNYFENIKVR